MAKAEFFSGRTVCLPQFFDAQTCKDLRAAAQQAAATHATVYDGGEAEKLNADVRRTLRAHVSAGVIELVTARLTAVKPAIEEHFAVPLSAIREPQFLVYRVGDFFSAHRDASPDDPPNVRIRKVSLVIFLNGEASGNEPTSFAGGSLVFYDLLDEPKLGHRGLPPQGRKVFSLRFLLTWFIA